MGTVSINHDICGTPNNSIIVLDMSQDGTTMSTTSASAATLRTYTLPAGTMGANDAVRITTLWTFLNNANAKFGYVDFGGSLVFNENLASKGVTCHTMHIVRNRNATNAQVSHNNAREGVFENTTGAVHTAAVDTSADIDIRIRAVSDGTDTVTCESVIIELLRAP